MKGLVITMKRLGFGLMRLPLTDKNDPASIDMPLLERMTDAFIERGFTYFDTAWMYCGFKSENAAGAALVARHPRESFTLASKLHAEYFDTLAGRDEIFNKQREKTGVDYFDYYLLHDVNRSHIKVYDELNCFGWLADKREKGLARHIGFSFHDTPEMLDKLLTEHPEMEFVQLQLNYLDWDSESVQSRRCYETAVRHGKKVVVMEPVKGGTLARVPQSVESLLRARDAAASVPSWAIRFAASRENVMMVLSGMSDMAQLLDNTATMSDFKPLDASELAMLAKAAEMIRSHVSIQCTGCSYCTEGCPMGIPIPRCFELYNEAARGEKRRDDYRRLTEGAGRAGDCIGCGQCEGVCPQHLPVRELLKKTAALFE